MWLQVDFADAPLVVSGTMYAIVASAPSFSNLYAWMWGSSIPDAYLLGGAWSINTGVNDRNFLGNDLGFKTYLGEQTDLTPPAILVSHIANGNNGWNTTASVPLAITTSDGESGIAAAPTCTDNGTSLSVSGSSSPYSAAVSGQGTHTISCSVSDVAGNSNSSGDTVTIDSTPPQVAVTSPPSGASYTLGAAIPAAACSTTDPGASATPVTGSGVATSALPSTNSGTAGVGTFTVTCAGATDVAGNSSASTSASYSVIYSWSGFFQPIDNKDASGNYILNKAKSGSTIPVKFSLAGDKGLAIFETGFPRLDLDPLHFGSGDRRARGVHNSDQRPEVRRLRESVPLQLEDRELGRHLPPTRRQAQRRHRAPRQLPIRQVAPTTGSGPAARSPSPTRLHDHSGRKRPIAVGFPVVFAAWLLGSRS